MLKNQFCILIDNEYKKIPFAVEFENILMTIKIIIYSKGIINKNSIDIILMHFISFKQI